MKAFRMCVFGLQAAMLLGPMSSSRADESVRLRESYAPGYQYHVSTRVELTGNLTLPPEKEGAEPKKLPLTGESAIEYDERVVALDSPGEVRKTVRIYRRLDFRRKVGDLAQQSALRSEVRRLVLLRLAQVEVPFSPDGPLLWSEIDLVRTDVFTPALFGLFPADAVRIGDRWPASSSAVLELTDLERVEEGAIACKLEQCTNLDGRRLARVSLSGTVRGINEDGPNRQKLEGYYFFDLESSHLSYLYLNGVHSLLDKDGKELGRVEGRFVLTRQAGQRCTDLSDEALKGVALEPNDDNTLLLYDNPDLGVRLLHPRRWRVAGVHGGQLGIDESAGSGLLLSLETSERAPAGEQFLKESRDWLKGQKAKILREEPIRRLQEAPRGLEQFAIDMESAGQRAFMNYYVIRQQNGGATIAARLLSKDLDTLRKEVERIARSVTITKKIVDAKK